MILYIDTNKKDYIFLSVRKNNIFLFKEKIKASFSQSEKLLPFLENKLKENKLKTKKIEKIIVKNKGNKFTSLRVGVLTANALAYSLKVDVENDEGEFLDYKNFNLVDIKYDSEPNISMPSKKIV